MCSLLMLIKGRVFCSELLVEFIQERVDCFNWHIGIVTSRGALF